MGFCILSNVSECHEVLANTAAIKLTGQLTLVILYYNGMNQGCGSGCYTNRFRFQPTFKYFVPVDIEKRRKCYKHFENQLNAYARKLVVNSLFKQLLCIQVFLICVCFFSTFLSHGKQLQFWGFRFH